MGLCQSKAADVVDKERKDNDIDNLNRLDAEKEAAKIKLLLLGAGESGKSTIFKQMRILYGEGYTESDRRLMLPVVHSNVLTSVKALIVACNEMGITIGAAQPAPAPRVVEGEAEAPAGAASSSGDSGDAAAAGSSSGGAGDASAAASVAAASRDASRGATTLDSPDTSTAAADRDVVVQAAEEGQSAVDAAAAIMALSDDAIVNAAVAANVKLLWADAGIQDAFASRHRFQLNDSARYWFEKIDEIASPEYVPSVEDVLKTRVRTSGILEEEYTIDSAKFCIYDVGGQRNERRKWIHCFQDVTAVIFVAAISEYDQVMFEDSSVNRLVDALKLFDDVCNSRYFENTSIILLLNKRDLFADKIRTTDLRQANPDPFAREKEPVLFADYTGGCEYEPAVSYIVNKFLSRNKNPKKEIYWHVTCATDTKNVSAVFNAAKDIILKHNLASSGFLE